MAACVGHRAGRDSLGCQSPGYPYAECPKPQFPYVASHLAEHAYVTLYPELRDKLASVSVSTVGCSRRSSSSMARCTFLLFASVRRMLRTEEHQESGDDADDGV